MDRTGQPAFQPQIAGLLARRHFRNVSVARDRPPLAGRGGGFGRQRAFASGVGIHAALGNDQGIHFGRVLGNATRTQRQRQENDDNPRCRSRHRSKRVKHGRRGCSLSAPWQQRLRWHRERQMMGSRWVQFKDLGDIGGLRCGSKRIERRWCCSLERYVKPRTVCTRRAEQQ